MTFVLGFIAGAAWMLLILVVAALIRAGSDRESGDLWR